MMMQTKDVLYSIGNSTVASLSVADVAARIETDFSDWVDTITTGQIVDYLRRRG